MIRLVYYEDILSWQRNTRSGKADFSSASLLFSAYIQYVAIKLFTWIKIFFQNLWPWPRNSADLQGEKLSFAGWLWLWTTHILIGISCFRVSVPCSLMVLLQLSFTWNILNPEISKNNILYLIISVYTWSCIVSRETLFSNKKIWYQVDFFGVF